MKGQFMVKGPLDLSLQAVRQGEGQEGFQGVSISPPPFANGQHAASSTQTAFKSVAEKGNIWQTLMNEVFLFHPGCPASDITKNCLLILQLGEGMALPSPPQ